MALPCMPVEFMSAVIWPLLSSSDASLAGSTSGPAAVGGRAGDRAGVLCFSDAPQANNPSTAAKMIPTTPRPASAHHRDRLASTRWGGCWVWVGAGPTSVAVAAGDGAVAETDVTDGGCGGEAGAASGVYNAPCATTIFGSPSTPTGASLA